ncbi:MAG: hypothetical protein M1331_01065 [Candidatus Marsarchaeota archaeon]|nr:hypothetical protein [Candidatus Marsarchaeota archaeon]
MAKINKAAGLLKGHKALVITLIAVAVVVVGLVIYVHLLLQSTSAAYPLKNLTLKSSISSSLVSSYFVFYNNTNISAQTIKQIRANYILNMLPYSLVSYNTYNISNLTINESIFKQKIPSRIYIWNTSGQCFRCQNMDLVKSLLAKYLAHYGINDSIQTVSFANITTIQNNSILLVMTGLIPQQMFFSVNNSTQTQTMTYLLGKGTSIIYTGQNFSRAVQTPFSTPVPATPPYYLYSIPNASIFNSSFYFTAKTFNLYNGTGYGPASYINYLNGSVVIFSNYPDTWKSPEEYTADIAKSIAELFWLPKYASGSRTVALGNFKHSQGQAGIVLSALPVPYSESNYSQLVTEFNTGYPRVVVSNSRNYSFYLNFSHSLFFYNYTGNSTRYHLLLNLSNYTHFSYIEPQPNFSLRGSLAIPSIILPTIPISANITAFVTCTSSSQVIEPSIYFYTINMTEIGSPIFLGYHYPCKGTRNMSSRAFSFFYYPTFNLPKGVYLAMVKNYNSSIISGGLFSVPNITINLTSEDLKNNIFVFYVKSDNHPLSGIPYELSLKGFTNQTGTITNGTIVYSLPKGTIIPNTQSFNFTLYMLSHKYIYVAPGNPIKIEVNQKYIILGVVGIITILMLVLVKAPNRDEFYIDIPSIPLQKKTPVAIDKKILLSVFTKLNLYYHWKFMPLTKDEIKLGIFNNIRFNGMPVNITYANLDRLLDQLLFSNDLSSIDGLYAPNDLIQQSGHDIEYLAVFKKMRVFFVSHTFLFTDINMSETADIAATFHNQKINIVIYSQTSRFQRIPIYENAKTYIAFLNAERRENFKSNLYNSNSDEAEILKLYISSGILKLINADSPDIVI